MEYLLAQDGIIVEGTSRNISKITGNPNYNDKLKNIYDLYGCSYEWTQSAYQYAGGRSLFSYGYNTITSVYGFETPDRDSDNDSSRITIYMN